VAEATRISGIDDMKHGLVIARVPEGERLAYQRDLVADILGQ
jgi:hypothetical protein